MPELPTTNCIRELRATQGAMTQIELPKNLGVTRQTVNAIELGKYPPPSLEVAFKIAAVFELPLEEVLQFRQ
jgi:putative transcriptional regulator